MAIRTFAGRFFSPAIVFLAAFATVVAIAFFPLSALAETQINGDDDGGADEVISRLDLTDTASAQYLTFVNKKSSSIRAGEGLYMISTKDAFETCNGQLSGSAATTPVDAVIISAKGDWTATVAFDLARNSSQGYYEFFGFYAMDDYDNMVGLRAGDSSIQDFLRVDGSITADTPGTKTSQGLTSSSSHWLRIEKTGDDYSCYWSTDGITFTKVCSYENTGITGDRIILDAYSGMATGYEYLVKSVDFSAGGASLPGPVDPTLDDIDFSVKASAEAGLDGDVAIELSKSVGAYSGILYLPGDVDASKLSLSWNYEDQVTVVPEGGTETASGSAPIAANGATAKYTVKLGNKQASLSIKTMQGSAGVSGLFLDIDEDYVDDGGTHTISEMINDENHEATCFGSLSFIGGEYDMSIKGRGNWTWFAGDKKPFNITIYKDEDPDKSVAKYDKKKNVEFIDGVKAKKWSLLANYADSSLMRNKIGYDLACKMGIGLDSRYIDVWMNGEYIGNYLMTAKSDYNAPDGGYLLEIDNNLDTEDPYFSLEGLDPAQTSENVITVKSLGDDAAAAGITANDIQTWMQTMLNAVMDASSDEYTKYVDVDSWAKLYMLQEYAKNHDIICGSILMHRDGLTDSDKLIAGPVWDLDNAWGRVFYNDHSGISQNLQFSADGWYIDGIEGYTAFLKYLGMHEDFMQRVYQIYNEYAVAFAGVRSEIDLLEGQIGDSAAMNFNVWNVDQGQYNAARYYYAQTINSFSSNSKYNLKQVATKTWDNYLSNLKAFTETRLAFFQDYLTVAAPEGSLTKQESGGQISLKVKLTSGNDDVLYCWQSSADGQTWADIDGATGATYTVPAGGAGLSYRCVVTNYGGLIDTYRLADVRTSAVTVFALDEPVAEEGFEATFVCDKHASVTAYPTKVVTGEGTAHATSALARDGKTGEVDTSGEGQVNFTVQVDEGWRVGQVSVQPTGNFKNLKLPEELGAGTYRITQVKGPVTVTVTTVADTCNHSFVDGVCIHCGEKQLESVRVQLPAQFNPSTANKADVRISFGIDCLEYHSVGLLFSLAGPAEADFTIDAASVKAFEATMVFSSLIEEGVSKKATEVFGEDRPYAAAFKVTGIPSTMFDRAIQVRPFAILEDETVVYGEVCEIVIANLSS